MGKSVLDGDNSTSKGRKEHNVLKDLRQADVAEDQRTRGHGHGGMSGASLEHVRSVRPFDG